MAGKVAASKVVRIKVSDRVGSVSGLVVLPGKPVAWLVLAHGAGAGMKHPFMNTLAMELASRSVATLRFNFPYMEKGGGRPDPPAIAEKAVEAAWEKAHALSKGVPIFAAGKSFGGRMSSQRLSKEGPDYVRGIIFYGFPLHAPGSPSTDRAQHLGGVKVPMLFLQGTRDALARIDLVETVTKALPLATLDVFTNADHSFKVPRKDLIPDLAEATRKWVGKILGE